MGMCCTHSAKKHINTETQDLKQEVISSQDNAQGDIKLKPQAAEVKAGDRQTRMQLSQAAVCCADPAGFPV